MDKGIAREEVERAARLYRQNKDASRALDITLHAFGRICRKYGIETPYARRRRRSREGRERREYLQ